ncbi:putative F-box/LRR-repeat protein [Cardamine amara subsp. amara]|uniref:F-box/LRR-repeat protein n=1 Tax=Cardamine amara subsp. amara TaxID=228776 RepID=A0ABD1BZV4_CARAN
MNSEKGDVISDLPDALICYILSFLPTKEAASVLAKRWKHLLAFVPNLDFDDSSYFHPPMKWEKIRKNSSRFTCFVDSVLALQATTNAPLNRFHVKCRKVEDVYYVFDWIPKVLKRGVLDIDVYISMGRSLYLCHLPSKIFVSKTLVRLKIKIMDGFYIKVKVMFVFRNLRLHLDNFVIKVIMFNKLLAGCNAFEELVLHNWNWHSEDEPCSVTVSTPTNVQKFARR